MTALRIEPCTAADLARLLADDDASPHLIAHHRERSALQAAGDGVYLLAWRGESNVGRATLSFASKYENVRRVRPGTAEINALEATPQGEGIGTALLRAAGAIACRRGHRTIGLAVEPSNPRARRLYERLGYALWGHGQVIDEWIEIHADHTVDHRDPCDYLIKTLVSQS